MGTGRHRALVRRPRQRRAEETVEVIVRATAQILSRDGAERLTTNRVAEEALVAEVRRGYEEAFRRRLLTLVDAVAALPLEAAVAECVRAIVAAHVDDPGLHHAVSAAGLGDGERQLLHQLAASWLEARRDEVRRPDRALAAAVALDAAEALVHGVALRAPERLADDAFAAEVTDMLVRYLARDGVGPSDRADAIPG
jgi:hypothetical protein